LKCIIFIFFTVENKTFHYVCKFTKLVKQISKQCLFLALSKYFSAVSAGDSEVTAASLDRQFHDSADIADISTASLDSTLVFSTAVHHFCLSIC